MSAHGVQGMEDPVVRGLGEIALRVNDLDRMQAFYAETVGLKLMRRFPEAAFFRIAEGYEGHTQILALFDRASRPDYQGLQADTSTIDHIAFAISLDDFESERRRLESLGLEVTLAAHDWVCWRSLYFRDPERNLVEFVCYDAGVSSSATTPG